MARKSGKGRAKGGGAGKTRQYVRDNNGRFASTPGGGGKKAAAKPAAKPAAKTPAKPKTPPKTSTARGRARTKAAEARKALRAGAGTRAARSLAIAQKAADYYKATGTGTKRKPARAAAKPAAKPAVRPAAAPKAAKPAAKPARRKPRKISEEKAGRIIARLDALRPGLRPAAKSDRRSRNALASYERASEFVLAASKRAIKRGQRIGVRESLRRAIANAKPKSAKPRAAAKPAGGAGKPAQAKPKQKTATQRAEAALERVRSVLKRAKYDPQNRRERNTARTAVRALGVFVDLGANPRYVASPADLRRLGRNLRNRTKLKEAGARNRWVSARSKEEDDRRRSRSGLMPSRR